MYRLNRRIARRSAIRIMNAKIKLKIGTLLLTRTRARSSRSYNFMDQAQKWPVLIPKRERSLTRLEA
jgi:hypothetical protein